MYFAGLNILITETQALNAVSWGSAIIWFRACWPGAGFRAKAHEEAGPIKAMPPGKQGQLVSVVHGLGLLVPMATFVFSLPFTGFCTPRWLARTSLPPVEPHSIYIGLRLAGCVGALVGGLVGKLVFRHLGSQWSAIGVRERPKIVKTGPYALVRHPGYCLVMAQELLFIPMFWNWIFAPAFVLTSIAFSIKMPIEEKVIENDKDVGDAYKQYKKEVPYRVIPYIW